MRSPEPDKRGAEAFFVSPFMRLARTHALGAASDAAIAVTLAGSIFLSDARRGFAAATCADRAGRSLALRAGESASPFPHAARRAGP